MTKEILGMKLDDLREPIRVALETYQDISDGAIEFDIDTAVDLNLTPEKPNSARSESIVKHLGEAATTLYIIALKPGDATGSYNSPYQQGTLYTSKYSTDKGRCYPRSKKAIDTEAHITLVSSLVDSNIEPTLFAGHLSVLGLDDRRRRIEQIGFVGQSRGLFDYDMYSIENSRPTTTLTTGYRDGLDIVSPFEPLTYADRFGDPHAIMNETKDTIQVCGFIGMPAETDTPRHDRIMLKSLRPVELRKDF